MARTEHDRRRRTGGDRRERRHHEVYIEPHAHPGEPRRIVVSERQSGPHEDVSPRARAPRREHAS